MFKNVCSTFLNSFTIMTISFTSLHSHLQGSYFDEGGMNAFEILIQRIIMIITITSITYVLCNRAFHLDWQWDLR